MGNDIEISNQTNTIDNEYIVEIGQWYWLKRKPGNIQGLDYCGSPKKGFEVLACVTHIGSNYVKLTTIKSEGSYSTYRIHLDTFAEEAIFEQNSKEVIQRNLHRHQKLATKYMEEVKSITALLGVSPQLKIEGEASAVVKENALMVQSSSKNVDQYKLDLKEAKEVKLPELFKKIKIEHSIIASWLSADAVPLSSLYDNLHDCLGKIDKRIFNVSLYAGLTEQMIHIREGELGKFHEKIHLMQRRLYMDEECLLNYTAGGMEFSNLDEFNSWLAQDENMERCLPFNKCIVAFKVRREVKWRGTPQSIMQHFINMDLKEKDNMTFLYLRNGGNLYLLKTEINFDSLIFPDSSVFDPTQPMMIDKHHRGLIPKSRWEQMRLDELQRRKDYDQWFLDNPYSEWKAKQEELNVAYKKENPFTHWKHSTDERSWKSSNKFDKGFGFRGGFETYTPFDKTNVYYDDMIKKMHDDIDKYNRVALIVQGLIDRSEIFHPHPPINLKEENSFQVMVKLIYDGTRGLYGEITPPDFEEYKAECNSKATKNSVWVGQYDLWLKRESKRKQDQLDNDWRRSDETVSEFYHPDTEGDPGPDKVSKADVFGKKVTFKWLRAKRRREWDDIARTVPDLITIPRNELFNVSAYKKGDYKMFFQDPRTRQKYLKWAPILLACEDFMA